MSWFTGGCFDFPWFYILLFLLHTINIDPLLRSPRREVTKDEDTEEHRAGPLPREPGGSHLRSGNHVLRVEGLFVIPVFASYLVAKEQDGKGTVIERGP